MRKKKKVKVSSTDIVKMAAGLVPGSDAAVLLVHPEVFKHCREIMSYNPHARWLVVRGVRIWPDDRIALGDVKFCFTDNKNEIFSVPGLEQMVKDMNELAKERDSTELFG